MTLQSKFQPNRTSRFQDMAILFKIGPKPDQGPLSGPGPVRFGPDPEDFSPVRSVTPGTLVCYDLSNGLVTLGKKPLRFSSGSGKVM